MGSGTGIGTFTPTCKERRGKERNEGMKSELVFGSEGNANNGRQRD
jgi:hypothetical protein